MSLTSLTGLMADLYEQTGVEDNVVLVVTPRSLAALRACFNSILMVSGPLNEPPRCSIEIETSYGKLTVRSNA